MHEIVSKFIDLDANDRFMCLESGWGMGDSIWILCSLASSCVNDLEFTLYVRGYFKPIVDLFKERGFLHHANVIVNDDVDPRRYKDMLSITELFNTSNKVFTKGSYCQKTAGLFGIDFTPVNLGIWSKPSVNSAYCCWYAHGDCRSLNDYETICVEKSVVSCGFDVVRHFYNTRQLVKTNVADQISEMLSCSLVISVDTGIVWLSAILGIPTLVIFKETGPNYQAIYPGWEEKVRRLSSVPMFFSVATVLNYTSTLDDELKRHINEDMCWIDEFTNTLAGMRQSECLRERY